MKAGPVLVIIWILNVGIVGAMGYVIVYHLVLSEQEDPLKGIDSDQPQDDGRKNEGPQLASLVAAMKALPNPLVKWEGPREEIQASPLKGKVKLIGTWPNPKDAKDSYIAVLVTAPDKPPFEAGVAQGQPIMYNGVPVASIGAWRLKEVYKEYAIFEASGGQTTRLEVEDALSSGTTAAINGGMQMPQNTGAEGEYNVSDEELRQVAQNADQILAQDVKFSPNPTGGIKVEYLKPDSYPAQRGFREGDVIKAVNGNPINSIVEANDLMRQLQADSPNAVTVTVERYGRTLTLQFKRTTR